MDLNELKKSLTPCPSPKERGVNTLRLLEDLAIVYE